MQNFPNLTFARVTATGLRVGGWINTEAGKTLRIEFFASPDSEPGSYGEGERYLGFITLQMGNANTEEFNALLPAWRVEDGERITATATDELGNTSEFSLAREVTATT